MPGSYSIYVRVFNSANVYVDSPTRVITILRPYNQIASASGSESMIALILDGDDIYGVPIAVSVRAYYSCYDRHSIAGDSFHSASSNYTYLYDRNTIPYYVNLSLGYSVSVDYYSSVHQKIASKPIVADGNTYWTEPGQVAGGYIGGSFISTTPSYSIATLHLVVTDALIPDSVSIEIDY